MRNVLIPFLTLLFLCGLSSCRNYLKMADESYALGEYYDAARMYKRAYSKTPAKERDERGRIAFIMGDCYRIINASANAKAAYINAIRYNYPDSITFFRLGEMQLKTGEYKNAEKSFETYLEYDPTHALAQNGLTSARMAPEMKNALPRYVVKRFDLFNSRRSEYSPAYNRVDSDRVYFTSTRDQARGDNLNGITGMKSADIFMARRNERNQWQAPETIDSDLNTEYEDGACSFSPDGNTMYFTRCRESAHSPVYAEIFSSSRSGANWSAAKQCNIINDTLSSVAHPAVSPDGYWLYFVSDMPGGYGGMDLWRCPILDGEFGAVENLGPSVNTVGDEMFPYVHEDGTLYFSSNGWPGMGGLDLFKAEPDPHNANHWKIQNMGFPMNSEADDFGITFEPERNKGFFSSNRKDVRGWDHIFEFIGQELDYVLHGWVFDMEGDPLPEATVNIIGEDGTNVRVSVNGDGFFSYKLDRNTAYLMLANCRGYLNTKQELLTDTITGKLVYEAEFPMASITRPVVIENIFYEFDKATLTPESSEALDKLIKMLTDNPNITIELGAHCDYFGSDAYNERLSLRRAQSVVDYLVKGGISEDRLTAWGYGENSPKEITKRLAQEYPFLKVGDVLTETYIKTLTDEEQEICNALNRRTEFKVIRTTYGLYQ